MRKLVAIVAVLSVTGFMLLQAAQATRYSSLGREVDALVELQEDVYSSNRKLMGDRAVLEGRARIDGLASKLPAFLRARNEDVLIIKVEEGKGKKDG